MQLGNVTTPFGRRPAKLALVKRQLNKPEERAGQAVDKWKVFRDVCEARTMLGIQDRALSVLNALLSFYPESELADNAGLIVFPSNAQLSVRAHGISGATLRRALATLIEAGLIDRRDSPNGKRYAHRDRAGEIEEAFGFSLAPLLARHAELAQLAQQVAEEARLFRRAKEALTICRRDVRKLITAAIEEGIAGNWLHMEAMYVDLMSRLPRSPSRQIIEGLLDEMKLLREEVINHLEIQENSNEMSGNDDHNERHIQNSNTESIIESEPRSEKEQGAANPLEKPTTSTPLKAFPLSMVLQACPEIINYGPAGAIANWRDLMTAAVVVRSMLGVSPSAYQEACEIMGQENAAVVIACILERAGHIKSAGGYLRDLTARAERGEFSLGPVIMALLRTNTQHLRLAN
ncbi:replication initiation protein RepC [Brucella intermedia]|uniref:plasmid replication protein RepC n=1 Tax=Brucella intermedia TaxID=94625 RepID=UPI00209B241A|nr:plasmid replication protein RepC [Brucella intermedia]MCO7728860.1 replication initiation protein RepC [Brucella intermedia]